MKTPTVRKTYKYKLEPTPAQARALETVLWRCRELYNAALEERKRAWEMRRVSVTFAMQSAQLPVLKEVRPEYAGRGLGSKLVRFALDDARRRGLRVIAICPYVQDYLTRHPEDHDIVVGGGRAT